MTSQIDLLKEKFIHSVYKEKAFLIKDKPFTLHHGGQSHIFLNHSIFLSKYKNMQLLLSIYAGLLPKKLHHFSLGAVDSVMSPILTGFLSNTLQKNVVITKEVKKDHGIETKLYGEVKGEIILIDDMTSTGTLLINAAKLLRQHGATVRFAILSSCKDISAIENLEKEGIKTYYIATYADIVETLWSRLSKAEQKIVLDEVQEKKYNWSIIKYAK